MSVICVHLVVLHYFVLVVAVGLMETYKLNRCRDRAMKDSDAIEEDDDDYYYSV